LNVNQDGLVNEYWLLVYECCHKGWISSTALTTIRFFEELSANGISFYDNTKQIAIGKSNIYGQKNPIVTVKIKKPTKKVESKPKSKYA